MDQFYWLMKKCPESEFLFKSESVINEFESRLGLNNFPKILKHILLVKYCKRESIFIKLYFYPHWYHRCPIPPLIPGKFMIYSLRKSTCIWDKMCTQKRFPSQTIFSKSIFVQVWVKNTATKHKYTNVFDINY